MTRSLPKGIHYEVSISRCNGRWYASIAYWKSPVSPPPRETQSVGGVDVGINPLAMDSYGTGYQNPKGYYTDQRRLRRWQRAQARRTPGSRGWWEAQRRIDSVQRRIFGLRNNAHHQTSRTLVRKYHTLGIESLNVAGMIKAGLQSKAPGRRRHVRSAESDTIQGPVVRYPCRRSRPVVSQQQDLLGLR